MIVEFFKLTNKKFLTEKFFFFLIFLFVFSLVSGSFLPDFILSLVSIFFFYFFYKNYKSFFLFTKNNIIKFFFIFYLYIVTISIFSEVPAISLWTSIFYIRFLLFLIIANILFQNKNFKNYFFYSILLLYSILFIDTIFQIKFGHNIFGQLMNADRPSSFFGRWLILGSFVSRTIAIALYLLFSLEIRKKILLYIYLIFITLFLVIVSSERTAVFMYFVTAFFSFFFIQKKNLLVVLSCILFTILLATYYFPKSFNRVVLHTSNQMFENNKIKFFSYRHELHYLSAIKIFNDHKLFGAGVKSFRYLCSDKRYSLKEKILKDNLFYAKQSGDVIFVKDFSNNRVKILIISEDMKSDILFQNYLSKKFNSDYYKFLLEEAHFSVYKNNYYDYGLIGLSDTYFVKGQKIIKGDPLFSYYPYENGCNTHPHNFYIQFLAELGLVGFCFLLSFYFYICFMIFKIFYNYKKELSPKLILYGGYFAILFPFIPNGNFFNNYLSLLIILPLCFFELCSSK
jgi:O-antigen ligase